MPNGHEAHGHGKGAWLMVAMAVPIHPGKLETWRSSSEFLGKLARSGHGFDAWFRSSMEDIHPMDLSAPPPPAPVRTL